MAELLLELLSEDIPARMQARAAEDLKRLVTEKLKDERLGFDKAEAYVTPRRLTLVIDGLPPEQAERTIERKGPRVGAPEQAIQGFLKSADLESVEQCEIRQVGNAQYYFATQPIAPLPTKRALVGVLEDVIDELSWPKSMRWANTEFRWVRPLQNIVAVFNGQTLEMEFDLVRGKALRAEGLPETASLEDRIRTLADLESGPDAEKIFVPLKASDQTRGHRFLAPEPFTVEDFADYKAKLKKARVILDPAERRKAIWKEAVKLAKAEGLTVQEDEALLAEVAGMVEWPRVLIGGIDEAFMDLPAEVLTTVMRHNQKYFSLVKSDGSLAPRFIVVADTEPDDGGRAITAGNERVLKARLSDARFFWDHDRKATLESRVAALEGIVFHAKLGTLAEKVRRLETLAAELVPCIPGADIDHVRRGALLSKADLTTEMVGEFPELQGVMGRYYALHDGERPEVAETIAEHYAPLGPSDHCPTAPVSVAVALADKIDTLVGFFAIGEKPTGSKDPYALRRAALGTIRLILENKLRLPLRQAFENAWFGGPIATEKGQKEKVIDDLLNFFADRLKVHLREKGVRHDLIDAVFALGGEDDLVRLMARVESLQAFLDTEDGEHLLTAYKRAANIVRIEEKRDGVSYDGAADTKRFKQPEERDLHDWLGRVKAESDEVLKEERFDDAMKILAGLRKPVDVFFDEVTVNCDEAALRENRLKLLSEIRTTMNTVADFSQIEG